MIEVSAVVGEKALRLVDEGCVRINSDTSATVKGDSSWHHVVIEEDATVRCDCRAWTPTRLCSHATAALLVWGEKLAGGLVGAKSPRDAAIDDAAPAPGVPPNVRPTPGAGRT